MEPEAYIGVRVVRGPHWLQTSGNQDGGEGHVGTIVDVCGIKANDLRPTQCVIVQWDAGGTPQTYRAGHLNAFDLSIYDNAGVGVKHNTTCSGCNVGRVYGLLWSCDMCRDVHLCSACYSSNCHDLNHQFTRLTFPSDSRYELFGRDKCSINMYKVYDHVVLTTTTSTDSNHIVPTRGTSERLPAIGIFENSTVVRGPDWLWKEQDGGPGKEGVVIAIVNFSPYTDRNAAEVTWNTGYTNIYRLGYKGLVDVKCSKPEIGGFYYRGHLPVVKLGAPGNESVTDVELHSQKTETPPPVEHESVNQTQIFMAGDKVRIEIDADTLKMMEQCRGTWNKRKAQCIGRTGIVVMTTGDYVSVDFDTGRLCELHQAALTKVSEISPGEIIQVNGSMEEVKKLQDARGGWNDLMAKVLGKKGRVIKIDDDGDINVAFGDYTWTFNPECLEPSSGDPDKDVYSSTNVSKSSLEVMTTGDNVSVDVDFDTGHLCELHQAALTKVSEISPGEIIQVNGSMEEVKKLQDARGGWNELMAKVLGKKGRVKKIDDDGDIEVAFSDYTWTFNPECLKPSSGDADKDVYSSTNVSKSSLDVMTTGDNVCVDVDFETGRLCELHQAALTKVSEISPGEIIQVNGSMEEVKKLQDARGGWNELMAKVLGKKGRVKKIDDDGDIEVAFSDYTWTFNPECLKPSSGDADKDVYSSTNVSKSSLDVMTTGDNVCVDVDFETGRLCELHQAALTKVSEISPGEIIQVNGSMEEVKKLQDARGGWNELMAKVLGKKGRVKKIDDDGDIEVAFGDYTWTFNPECLKPSSGDADKDVYSSTNVSKSSLDVMTTGDNVCVDVDFETGRLCELHQAALTKVSEISPGEIIQVNGSMEEVKKLQDARGGWNELMAKVLGKKGCVIKIDDDGDINVAFGDYSWTFNPECLKPSSGDADKDVYSSTNVSKSSLEGTTTDSTVMQQNGDGDDFDTCAKEVTITTKDISALIGVSMEEIGAFHDNDTKLVKKTSSTNETDNGMNQLPTQEETFTKQEIIVDQVDCIDVSTRPPEAGHGDGVQLHHDHHTPQSPTRHSESIEGTMTDLTVMHKNRDGDDYGTCAKEETIITEDTSNIVDVRIEKIGASRDNDTPLVKKNSSTNETNVDMNQEDGSIKREQTSATGDWNVECIDADDPDIYYDASPVMDVESDIYHDDVTLLPKDSSIIDGGNCIVF